MSSSLCKVILFFIPSCSIQEKKKQSARIIDEKNKTIARTQQKQNDPNPGNQDLKTPLGNEE
jgi:hypothetical protein